jgi:alpha-mannosidase
LRIAMASPQRATARSTSSAGILKLNGEISPWDKGLRGRAGRRFLRSAGVMLISAMLGMTLSAQATPAEETEQIVQSLSASSQNVVRRLSELNRLPAEEWRFHADDMEHLESPSLDDAAWPAAKPGLEVAKEALWFRRWIEIPQKLHGYDLTAAKVWFQFHIDAAEIIYFDGRRVAGGDDLEPVVLFDSAKPGDKVFVAVKAAHSDDTKQFGGVDLKVEFSPARPNPEDLRLEFLSAAVLIPSLSQSPSTDMQTLEKAIAAVNLNALDDADAAAFDASLEQARSQLVLLRPLLRQVTFHETGNAHIDAAWLWPWTETVDAVRRTFGTSLQLMNEYPYTFTQSAAVYNDWMAEKYPAINEEIKRRIQQGRWETVGGMWVEPDLNLPDGESLVRSLLLGKRWFQKEYGTDVRIGWNPDSFGYNWQLPQIYKKSGIDYFVTQKLRWNDTNQLPLKLFWWQSPDGSKVLTYLPHNYDNSSLDPLRLSIDLAAARKWTPGLTEMLDLYGVGDHGGGPTRAMLDEGMHWMQPGMVAPKMEFGTVQSYFTAVEGAIDSTSPLWNYDSVARGYEPPAPSAGKIGIPTWNDELYFEFHRGVFTTQAAHKRNMRESVEHVVNAEKYAALAWLDGDPYPGTELTEAWKKITFNDFHDLAAGSGIGTIYKDAQRDYDQVQWATNEISSKALQTLAAAVNTRAAGEVPVFVVNPLAWERPGLARVDVQLPDASVDSISVLDAQNQVVPSEVLGRDRKTNTYRLLLDVRGVPSLGYKVLHVVPGSQPFESDLKVQGLTLENSALRVTIDSRSGCITSLYDKRDKFEALQPGSCGNQLQVFADHPKCCDAWNIDPGTLDHFISITKADRVELINRGPLRAVVRVTRTWQHSKFVQEIILREGSSQLEIENDIDWHETHVLLKVAFPLAVHSAKATYEIPYGTIARPTTRNNSWEQAKFEVPALRWADLSDGKHGFALINDSKYGYDCKDSVLRLSLLRSPVDPDANADQGRHHFRYALYPHAGDWKDALTLRRGYEFNYPLEAQQVAAHAGSFPLEHAYLRVRPENVALTALKKAEDTDGLILRVYEWAGKSGDAQIDLPKRALSAMVTSLLERPQGQPLVVQEGHVTVPIHPYEILTLRVDYAQSEPSQP